MRIPSPAGGRGEVPPVEDHVGVRVEFAAGVSKPNQHGSNGTEVTWMAFLRARSGATVFAAFKSHFTFVARRGDSGDRTCEVTSSWTG